MTVPGPSVLDVHDAARAAVRLRRELGVAGDAPLPCALRLAEEHLGLDVVVARLPPGCSGFYFPRSRRGLVATNGGHAVVRQRFTVAHEVGHHVLGHGAAPRTVALAETPAAVEVDPGAPSGEAAASVGDGPADDGAAAGDGTGSTRAPVPAAPRRSADPRERSANAFAAELLCPAHAARSFVARHAVGGADGKPVVDFDLVVRMSCAFGISAAATLVRLETSGVLTDLAVRRPLDDRVAAAEHLPRYAELGLDALQDELEEINRIGTLPRLPEGVEGDVILAVTDPARGAEPMDPGVRELRRLLGVDPS